MPKFSDNLEIEGVHFPIAIHVEKRKSVRVSLGRSGGIVRLPRSLDKESVLKHLDLARKWLRDNAFSNEEYKNRFSSRTITSGKTYALLGEQFVVEVKEEERATGRSRIKADGKIEVLLPKGLEVLEGNMMLRRLISRSIGSYFLPKITERVHALNDLYFQQQISTVRLKYNRSNWGSCSSKDNINLSTRLLFAPPKVIDYVIIHELAHLLEMNHSQRFWTHVRNAMPDYKEQEQWLRTHGSKCDF